LTVLILAGGTNVGDELAQLKSSLKGRKENWQSSVNEAQQSGAERKDFAAEIEAGKVKANMDR
jgi:hypothetical protein